MNKLILYGAGYPNIIKLIEAINQSELTWEIIGFIDDTPEKQDSSFMGYPVLGSGDVIDEYNVRNTYFFNNVYANTFDRQKITDILLSKNCQLTTLIHPHVDNNFVSVGEGAIISEGVVLGANVTIGKHVAVRDLSGINHDCVVEDNVFIGPGVILCGHVTIESGAYIGAGCTIKERIKIGKNSIVGAGSIVIKDVPPNVTVAGVPAIVNKLEGAHKRYAIKSKLRSDVS